MATAITQSQTPKRRTQTLQQSKSTSTRRTLINTDYHFSLSLLIIIIHVNRILPALRCHFEFGIIDVVNLIP